MHARLTSEVRGNHLTLAGMIDEHADLARLLEHAKDKQLVIDLGGVTFINLEDETGMLNVTCTAGLWQRFRRVVRLSNALVVRGILENVEGVLNLRADHVRALAMPTRSSSRDFR